MGEKVGALWFCFVVFFFPSMCLLILNIKLNRKKPIYSPDPSTPFPPNSTQQFPYQPVWLWDASFFSKEESILFAGKKKSQAPYFDAKPRNILLNSSTRSCARWNFFLQLLNIRVQSFLLPAERNVIKLFYKRLYKATVQAPPECPRVCFHFGLGSPFWMF